MATVTFTYTFEIADDLAREMEHDFSVGVYGCGALGTFLTKNRLPAVYSSDPHSIAFEFAPQVAEKSAAEVAYAKGYAAGRATVTEDVDAAQARFAAKYGTENVAAWLAGWDDYICGNGNGHSLPDYV